MKVLFDTNVVLDALLDRHPHAEAAVRLISLVDQKRISGFLGATTLTTIHYLASKAVGVAAAGGHVAALLALFDVAPVDALVLRSALSQGFADYEDAVLHAAAVESGCQAIVTRNLTDFSKARLPVYSPPQLLAVAQALEQAALTGGKPVF